MTLFSQAVAAQKSGEIKRTDNGMKAFVTTDSKVLDLFGVIGSSRGKNITHAFDAALAEDSELAVRTLLWARDVRGGAGERQTFRSLLQALERVNPALAGRIMSKVPFLGRWDDLFAYEEAKNRIDAMNMFADALRAGDKLAAKWAPRHITKAKANTPGKKEMQRHARDLMGALGLRSNDGADCKQYRQLLSSLTEVVETAMCAKQWDSINFSHVPSLASARYQKAFGKRASEKYAEYIRELQKPEEERAEGVKINAGAVFPYDVIKSLMKGNEGAANAQWDALPDFVGDGKIMPMVDTSASMTWEEIVAGLQPMHVAMSLGLYLSDRTSSDFKDMFMTFDSRPQIHVLKGTLSQKFRQLQNAPVGGGTDLNAAFDLLLSVAVTNRVAPENMPSYILVLTDMQFNQCARYDDRALDMIRRKYAAAGYNVPGVIFWNLSPKGADKSKPVKTTDNGAALVSGFSPALMAAILGADPSDFTPYSMMMRAIMSDRYNF